MKRTPRRRATWCRSSNRVRSVKRSVGCCARSSARRARLKYWRPYDSDDHATLGDVIVVTVKEATANAKVKKGDVCKAVIVRTRKEVNRGDGTYVRFDT